MSNNTYDGGESGKSSDSFKITTTVQGTYHSWTFSPKIFSTYTCGPFFTTKRYAYFDPQGKYVLLPESWGKSTWRMKLTLWWIKAKYNLKRILKLGKI